MYIDFLEELRGPGNKSTLNKNSLFDIFEKNKILQIPINDKKN